MDIRNILAFKGVHYLIRRYGPSWLRSRSFDAKYRRGDWNFKSDLNLELRMVVQPWIRNGEVLVLGCGEASITQCFEEDGLCSALGVDLSDEAIQLAKRYGSKRVSFKKADMLTFVPPNVYDLILFSESLYYVSVEDAYAMLRRLSHCLKGKGVMVATFAQPKRYQKHIQMIRDSFHLEKDQAFEGSSRHLLVFSRSNNESEQL